MRPDGSTIIGDIEDAIVATLKTRMASTAAIAPFPADPRNFDAANEKLAVLVHFSEGAYGRSDRNDGSSQSRVLTFTVILVVRELGQTAAGAYCHVEAVRQALQFQRFAGSDPARMVSERLVGEAAGRWEWHVRVAVPVTAVAATLRPAVTNPREAV